MGCSRRYGLLNIKILPILYWVFSLNQAVYSTFNAKPLAAAVCECDSGVYRGLLIKKTACERCKHIRFLRYYLTFKPAIFMPFSDPCTGVSQHAGSYSCDYTSYLSHGH
ncbi:hypothetical protein I7I48_11860 [Histoplasma ohiense]|nr:hypothetical protein I7I48_11860 [Histoplasma ohiense (nom. inval.)]